ncbi:toxin C-terminal domain-containing protein [Streptomyces sp. NPDC088146]|uniref:toxin C-terminal domain-containing protein n=1 Tax=Streptomyces sp. NPDC088146 TaxID=3365829 RepID=UPI0038080A9C
MSGSGSAGVAPGVLRRHWKKAVLAVVVILAVLAGALSLLGVWDSDEPGAEQNREPFTQALRSLAEARGLRYKDTAMAGITQREITVTRSGALFGATGDGVKDLDQDVLRIGGKTYSRWKKARDYETPEGKRKDPDAPGRWTIGTPGESYVLDPVLAQFLPPTELAFKLWDALDELKTLPDPDDPDLRPPTVDGVPALRADTSAGSLVVARNKPYRVLRLEPYDLSGRIKDQLKQLQKGAEPSVPPQVTRGPLKDGDSEGMSLSPVSRDQAEAMYDTLEGYTERLDAAVDDGVDFTLDGSGDLKCGNSGCSVRQKFTGKLSTEARTRITGGNVTAVLSATVTIDGQYAGRCTSRRDNIPFSGSTLSGALSCSAPEAGPVFAQVDAEYKARAERQARASGGRVTVRFYSRASTLIDATALAMGEADRLTEDVRQERRGKCSTGQSSGAQPSAQLSDSRHPIGLTDLVARSGASDNASDRPQGEVLPASVTVPGPAAGDHRGRSVPASSMSTGVVPARVDNANCNPITRAQSDDIARYLGYTKTNKKSAGGAPIWENKKAAAGQPRYITWDRNGHKGGIFKGAGFRDPFQSTKDSARDGTYDLDVSPSGDIIGLKRVAK